VRFRSTTGERTYGNEYTQALEAAAYDEQTLRAALENRFGC